MKIHTSSFFLLSGFWALKTNSFVWIQIHPRLYKQSWHQIGNYDSQYPKTDQNITVLCGLLQILLKLQLQKGINSIPSGRYLVRVNGWPKVEYQSEIVHTTFWDGTSTKIKQRFCLLGNWQVLFQNLKLWRAKATTEYGGRKWTAWFTKEIPIQDGYINSKFARLILKIEDETKSHIWDWKAFSQSGRIGLSDLGQYSITKEVNYNQYIKKIKSYRTNLLQI